MPMTRLPYSSEFREQMVQPVRAGRSPEEGQVASGTVRMRVDRHSCPHRRHALPATPGALHRIVAPRWQSLAIVPGGN